MAQCRRFCFGLVLGVWALAGVLPACAATQTVTNTNDSGPGSLRDAIAVASAGDMIQFAPTVTGTITLTSGELLITKNLTIMGPGASQLAISGNQASRVFEISSGATVAISGLTIENGTSISGLLDGGGGILNQGTLTLTNSTVAGNSAGSGVVGGGGLYNSGTATVTNSTVSGNSAYAGGGLYNFGTLTLTNSTVAGNLAPYGGGLYNFGTLTLTNSTIAVNSTGNPASIYIGGILDGGGTLTIKSTLLASNSNGNCSLNGGSVQSQGYNLSDDNSCASAFTAAGDQNNVVKGAGLDPSGLQNNGGPTQTIALLPTSPAVDLIPVANCTDPQGNPITTDQRSVARPQGASCDVGAFELGANAPTIESSGPFQINYASNLNIGDGVINITNSGASAGSNEPLVGQNSYGDICVNAYVYAPDQELATCCSCLVSPNSLHAWPVSFGPNNLLSNVTNTAVLTSINTTHAIVIKLLATPASGDLTSATGAICPGPDAPGTGVTVNGGITGLANGLVAWGTHAYPTNTATVALAETTFVPATLSAGELGKLTDDCRALLTRGSGRVCPACRTGGLVTSDSLTIKLP